MKMPACITVERSVLCGSFVGEVFGAFRVFFEDERKSRIDKEKGSAAPRAIDNFLITVPLLDSFSLLVTVLFVGKGG